mmetsp:Transcript_26617/g.44572  ORF Transcript_26617/g.44572 Transcript_26617/m.44572 type:complete len:241 (+) Transcript_26617:207-929(+)
MRLLWEKARNELEQLADTSGCGLKQLILRAWAPRLGLRELQQVGVDAIQNAVHTTKPSRVPYFPVHNVANRVLGDQSLFVEGDGDRLRGRNHCLVSCRQSAGKLARVCAVPPRGEPHAVRLKRVHPEVVVLRVEVWESLLYFKARNRFQKRLLVERSNHRRNEAKVLCEQGRVADSESARKIFFGFQNELVGLDGEGGRSQHCCHVHLALQHEYLRRIHRMFPRRFHRGFDRLCGDVHHI